MAGQNNWEFLLQQEGDRSWLPLESPDVEILEGRYRVMARTVVPDTLMDIRITHESTDELPIKRRTQVRSGKTNATGLLLVIPFTQMQPGVWELAIGVPNDAIRNVQEYSVQLHVLPKESDVAGEWEPDWSQPEEPKLQSAPASKPASNVAAISLLTDPVYPAQILSLEQLKYQEADLLASLATPDESEQALTTAEDDLFASLDDLIPELPPVSPESVQVLEPIATPIASTAAEPIPQDHPVDRQTITKNQSITKNRDKKKKMKKR